MSADPIERSIVTYIGENTGSCGYCKNKKALLERANKEESANKKATFEGTNDSSSSSSAALRENSGCVAYCLSLHCLNQLLDLGWSSSGTYLYKPLETTCCPQYTIRLDTNKFRLSRTQKRVLRVMLDFLMFDKRPNKREKDAPFDVKKEQLEDPLPTTKMLSSSKTTEIQQNEKSEQKLPSEGERKIMQKDKSAKKKFQRRKRAQERLLSKGVDLEKFLEERAQKEAGRQRSLESYLKPPENWWKHKLETKLIEQPSDELESWIDEEFEVYRRYQTQVHGDSPGSLTLSRYRQFLASSPLIKQPPKNNSVSSEKEGEGSSSASNTAASRDDLPALGSYHLLYLLDGRIIAVGVVDLLPQCLSAKYLFYDPEYQFLSLGTYSALNEIATVRGLAKNRPALHYYYMGYYLFDCPKMRYKGRFRPSELLCNACFQWVPLDVCDRLLAESGGRYTTFHRPECPPSTLASSSSSTDSDSLINQIDCLIERKLIRFGALRQILSSQGGTGGEGEGSSSSGEKEQETTTRGALESTRKRLEEFAKYAGPVAPQIIVHFQ